MLGMGKAYHTSSLMARRELMIDPPKFYYTAYSYGFGDQPRAVWFALNGGIRFIDRPMSVYRVRSNPSRGAAISTGTIPSSSASCRASLP